MESKSTLCASGAGVNFRARPASVIHPTSNARRSPRDALTSPCRGVLAVLRRGASICELA
jgi:hypothetical protein